MPKSSSFARSRVPASRSGFSRRRGICLVSEIGGGAFVGGLRRRRRSGESAAGWHQQRHLYRRATQPLSNSGSSIDQAVPSGIGQSNTLRQPGWFAVDRARLVVAAASAFWASCGFRYLDGDATLNHLVDRFVDWQRPCRFYWLSFDPMRGLCVPICVWPAPGVQHGASHQDASGVDNTPADDSGRNQIRFSLNRDVGIRNIPLAAKSGYLRKIIRNQMRTQYCILDLLYCWACY